MESHTLEMPLPPRRGLVTAVSPGRRPLPVPAIEQWLHVNRVTFKALKADVFAPHLTQAQWRALLVYADTLDLAVSLGLDGTGAPPDAPAPEGLLDLVLRPARIEAGLVPWVRWAGEQGLSLRLDLPVGGADPGLLLELLDAAGDCLVTVLAYPGSRGTGADCREAVAALETRAASADWDLVLAGFAPGTLAASDRAVPGLAACLVDVVGYGPEALRLARRLEQLPRWAGRALLHALCAQGHARLSQADNFVLALTLHKRLGLLSVLEGLHRLFRHGAAPSSLPPPLELLSPQEAPSALPTPFRDGGATDSPSSSWPVLRYADAVDRSRRAQLAAVEDLAAAARSIVATRPADSTLTVDQFEAENAHTIALPGARRWFSVVRAEKCSEPLGELERPWTLELAVGGGHASYGGFAVGRHGRLVTALSGLRHVLILHCDAEGRYVLLRDGVAVEPVTFSRAYYVPLRIPQRSNPRLVLWDIDKEAVVQAPRLWLGNEAGKAPEKPPRFSFLIVSVRYARRLQAALLCLARQQDFDLGDVEVLVAYVPEQDATDDVLNSLETAFPALRIVRMPFSAQDATAKGFLINETAARARGEWAVIMDSDILLPPRFLAALDEAARAGAHFIAPDGRKMVDPATTGRILLGLVEPHAAWADLLAGPGEYRQREAGGLPIGFLQCVRREALLEVPYEEWGHFEGADWRFADAMRQRFGAETWLEGTPVLHLDHGGSQWYGATRQF